MFWKVIYFILCAIPVSGMLFDIAKQTTINSAINHILSLFAAIVVTFGLSFVIDISTKE